MKHGRWLLAAWVVWGCGGSAAVAGADGVVTGWDSVNGQVLLGELSCAACHAAEAEADRLLSRQAPILDDVGGRVTPQYLRAFLAHPHQVKAGTPMPDLLHALPEPERADVVEELVHYLASLGGPIDQRSSGASKTQIDKGKELYHSVGCVACHQPFEPPPQHKIDTANLFIDEEEIAKKPASPSVPLGELSAKTTVAALARFLSDPLHTRPSGRMPSLNLKPGEANLIAAYLLRDQYSEKDQALGAGLDFAYYEGSWSKVPDFETLTPKAQGDAKSIDLNEVQQRIGKKLTSNFAVRFQGLIEIPQDGGYRFWTKSDDGSVLLINGKRVVDNDGIHPPQEKEGTIQLTKGRHLFEVGLIQGGGGFELSVHWQPPGAKAREPIPPGVLLHSAAAMIPKGIIDFRVAPEKVEAGRQRFTALGCASCHVTDRAASMTLTPLKAPALAALNPGAAAGCLGEKVAAGRPRYALSDAQRSALQQTLTEMRKPARWNVAQRLDHTLTAMNCFACHVRDGKGGPDRQRSNYFTYDIVVDLGDEGRLPPSLNVVGAKLTAAGFEDAFSGQKYRTYMATRMPHFGKANASPLPELFAQADADKVPPRQPAFSSLLVDDGRKLIGKNTLACVNCHAWGEYRLPGAEGLDLLQVTRRVQPGYFHALLADPQQLRPGTRMPGGWPDGKSFFTDIQDGDMNKQIDAVWAYLSTGSKGGLPEGLAPTDDSWLIPTAEPIVFRTFLDGIGAHAILVGFRQRTHTAFDANRVRLAVAWTGNFITTKEAWEGRAGQYAKIPSNDVVHLPAGPTFARLASLSDLWPADIPKAKLGSKRTPPGYQFLGYCFDDQGMPTFRYRLDDIEVEETPGTDFRKEGAVLFRHFQLAAREKDISNLYLRLAVGKKIVPDADDFLVDDRLRFRVSPAGAIKPFVRTVQGSQELLVPVRFAPSANDKGQVVKLDVEMMW
ncbi:MAG: PA14 domain-containing protein [Gemmataceae bacterium]